MYFLTSRWYSKERLNWKYKKDVICNFVLQQHLFCSLYLRKRYWYQKITPPYIKEKSTSLFTLATFKLQQYCGTSTFLDRLSSRSKKIPGKNWEKMIFSKAKWCLLGLTSFISIYSTSHSMQQMTSLTKWLRFTRTKNRKVK